VSRGDARAQGLGGGGSGGGGRHDGVHLPSIVVLAGADWRY
jgi:hypothetical protein